jgi:membrane-bound serine protease (ClpP class)
MRNVLRAARLLVAASAIVGSFAFSAGAQATTPTIVQLKLNGVVDPFEANYIKSGIDAANAQGAAAVLLTIDTPGGLDSSMRQIIQAIVNSDVPVICYVSPSGARAASAGTFIMMGCDVAAMAPGTNIGAAHPVGVAGAIEQKKVTNDAVAYIQSLATMRGRNADWAKDAVVNSVSIPAQEALDIDVIDLISPDVPTLLRQLDGTMAPVAGGRTVTLHTAGATIEQRNLGVGATLLHTLLSPDFAFIFFYLGIGLIIIELLHPGLSIPGILGVLSLIAAFVTFGLLPVQIVGVALLLASAAFFLLELKHPGIGVPMVGGVIALVAGGLTLFNPSVPNARVSLGTILPVAAFLFLFFATVVKAAMRARRMPTTTGPHRLVGMEGIVERDLEPEGVVHVGSEQWTAHAVSGSLSRGTRVRVTKVEGLRLEVEPLNVDTQVTPAPAVSGQAEGRAT